MKIATTYAGATEYVCALGLGEHLVAISHECDHPAAITHLPRVTKTFVDTTQDSGGIHRQVQAALAASKPLFEVDFEALKNSGADTVITQAMCGVCAVTPEHLKGLEEALGHAVRVLTLSPTTFQEVLDDVLKVGDFCDAHAPGAAQRARALHADWQSRVLAIRRETLKQRSLVRTLALEWLDPPMAAGHWTAEMVALCGGAHDMNPSGPAKTVTWQEVVDFGAQLLLVMPCGFGRERAEREFLALPPMPDGWQHTAAARDGRVYCLDGLAYFNRSGPRLVDSLELMAEVIHPEKFAGFFKDRPRRQAARQVRR